MVARDAELTAGATPELEDRVGERFGVLPNFFRLAPETPEITKNCGDLPKLHTWTTLCRPYSRSGSSFISLAFAQSAIALHATWAF